MLVPLTSSLYVSGTVTKPKEVLLDIGTGYFVQVLVDAAACGVMSALDFLMQHC